VPVLIWHLTPKSICADGSRSHGVCNDENNYEYIFYTDVNGDGNIDICNRADLGVRCHDSTTLSNKLKVITNGFGIQTTLNYPLPLTLTLALPYL
jgi:hypothetical protein